MEKMTSGEIAKKAGISQKAVRLYDEKGLLKPSEYSEGNYRLYDKEALLILENIIALKQIGFSLEEIRDNLIVAKNMDIKESLNRQLDIMEKKKAEIERTIGCIRGVLTRAEGEPDWNSVAEIARMIQQDQSADESHWHALKHNVDNQDWYVRIYETLDLQAGAKVLDLGCGFAKLWRNNWKEIPQDVKVDGIDLHGSWADNFDEYLQEHKGELAEGTDISLHWGDLDETSTWEPLQKGTYSLVVAHYLLSFLKDEEIFLKRVSEMLTEGGMFSCNRYDVSRVHDYWKQALAEIGLDTRFIDEVVAERKAEQAAFRTMLGKYFRKTELVTLANHMSYDNVDELFERLCDFYKGNKKYLLEKEGKIRAYFEKLLAEQGEVVLANDSQFWHCWR